MSLETIRSRTRSGCSRCRGSWPRPGRRRGDHRQNGRYGPYIKKGADTRSLDAEEQLLTLTLDEALALLAQPKMRRGRGRRAPLRELGADPASGKPIVLKDGRFGPM